MTQPVDSASLSWIIAFLRTWGPALMQQRHKGGEPESWGLVKSMWAGLQLLSGQPRFPSWGEAAERAVLTCLSRDAPSSPPSSASKTSLLPSLSRLALLLSAAHLPWMGSGEEGSNWKKRLWVLWRHPQPWGRWGKGPSSTRELACLISGCVDYPSIYSLWRWRGRVP